MSKINLIPEVKQEQIKLNKINLAVTSIAIGAAVLVSAVLIVLFIYLISINLSIKSIETKTKNTEEELLAYKKLEENVVSLERGLNHIKSISLNRNFWPKFFDELEKSTPGDVKIESFSNTDNEIVMSLSGKDVESIDRFVKSFSSVKKNNENVFNNVTVSNFDKSEEKVSFEAKMTLNRGVFNEETK